MRRITPVLVFLFVLAACGSDGDEAANSTTSTAVESSDTTATPDDEPAVTTTAEVTTTESEGVDEETTTSEAAVEEEPDDDIGILCSAYLESITPGSIDSGLANLADVMGPDAPSGVQAALETLLEPDGDIEGYFQARNSIDGYVLPICDERFRSAIVPEADDATAADLFVDAVREGNRPGAERLAPTNAIVTFGWNGYPETTANFAADNSTLSMVLEPTVTVFCQLDGGAIEFCAFGE